MSAVGMMEFVMDDIDLRIVQATQGGLPLVPEPYQAVAGQLGIPVRELMDRLLAMQATGAVRRIGVVPNHYALGYKANGMTVWDVDDVQVDELGQRIGRLDFVSHCYRRPRRLPQWPYNLFAMVHGHDRQEVMGYVAEISRILGKSCHHHDVLYNSRILKKTGLRIGG